MSAQAISTALSATPSAPMATDGAPTHSHQGKASIATVPGPGASCPPAAVRAQLQGMLAHSTFARAPCLSRLLAFVVERTLAGDGPRLKEYVLGVEVLGRRADFDPRIDTIVRVHCRRLRRKLGDYYGGEGRHDRVRIDMPKGHYAATFHWQPGRVDRMRTLLATMASSFLRIAGRAVARRTGRRILAATTAGMLALVAMVGWALPDSAVSAPSPDPAPSQLDPGRPDLILPRSQLRGVEVAQR